jgi:hypothetical protein
MMLTPSTRQLFYLVAGAAKFIGLAVRGRQAVSNMKKFNARLFFKAPRQVKI